MGFFIHRAITYTSILLGHFYYWNFYGPEYGEAQSFGLFAISMVYMGLFLTIEVYFEARK